MDEQFPSAPDEDALAVPGAWFRGLHPRRGGRPGPRIKVDGSAVAAVRERFGELEATTPLAEHAGVGPDSAEAARDHLAGGANPHGAAVVAALLAQDAGHRSVDRLAAPLADSWVTEHGLAFAARAFAELSQITWGFPGLRPIEDPDSRAQGRSTAASTKMVKAGARLRALLAAAGDDEYTEAVDALAEHRRTATQRAAVSFLVPTRHDWVDDCFAAPPDAGHEWDFWQLMYASLATPAQVDQATASITAHRYLLWWWDRPLLVTMVDGAGTAVAPLLARALEVGAGEQAIRKNVPEVLAFLPDDGAFQALLDHAGEKHVRPALPAAMKRFPARAFRLLAPAAAGNAELAGRLAEHVRADPGTAAELLPSLPPETAAVVGALIPGHDLLPDAPADALPRPLADPPWLRRGERRPAADPADPLEALPARIPAVGDWADARTLPQIRLRGREDAVPAGAVRHLLTMLAMSEHGAVYAGVELVKEACDPESLTEFAWALFLQWDGNGAPAKGGWALAQLGWLGDDSTVSRLTPRINAWPGEGGHRRAVAGLDVLAAIGTDMALTRLHGIAQKARFKGLKARAQEKIQEVADRLGLTADQLADRLVPHFGLDAGGGLVLDYGPRRFHVGFDEALRPYVSDEDGTRRKALPKPGAKDDPELAPAAYKRFAALKKDVRTVAALQIGRLEAAMVARRRWTAGEFRRLFAEHPLIWHIARRLVWIAEDGGKSTAFRVAEDRTFADAGDGVLTLPESAAIGVLHPAEPAGADLGAWSAVLADYEIVQPFRQLDRAVHALTAAERASRRLDRFQGASIPGAAVHALERHGWRRTSPMDAGLQHALYRELPGGLLVNIRLEGGIPIGAVEGTRLEEIWLAAQAAGDFRPEPHGALPFGDLDPVSASEVLAELCEAVPGG
ncbi:DUF4132 domain-containing protein [Actinomadura sp. 21ATH]|uniref:DUF4132 domain-containing protein n=1 Tax=Actinomadura sp. 21ATH TaxID=1735444 RepID=UPI0035BF06E9